MHSFAKLMRPDRGHSSGLVEQQKVVWTASSISLTTFCMV